MLARRPVEDPAGAVDVALDDVPAEACAGRDGAFEVDRVADRQVAQRRLSSDSSMTSAANASPSCSMTVRQQPLTAIESPCWASDDDQRAADRQAYGVAERLDAR